MENIRISIIDKKTATPAPNDGSKLGSNDSYVCTTCPYPIEILKIDDIKNT